MSVYLRSDLGDFNSIICFRAVITGMEDMLGEKATAIALKGAGRKRGEGLATSLGFIRGQATLQDLDGVAVALDEALGVNGTRLCAIDKIDVVDDVVRVHTRETVCSAYEQVGVSERTCTFTLGAVWGAMEFLLDRKFTAQHTDSVLRGGTHDVFEFTPR